MSIDRDREYLQAELAQIDRLIAGCEPDEELTRIGFEARRADALRELSELSTRQGRIARGALVFRGAPVLGARGVEADFGGQALELFQKLVSKAAAARMGHPLGTRGPIPSEQSARLFVTGTAPGSFGFILEEAADVPLLGATPLAEALDDTGRLLAAARDDELFADSVAQTDPEVIRALSSFLEVVSKRGATLRVRAGDMEVALDDDHGVRAAYERTATARQEADVPVEGTLEGLLPNARRFELRRSDTRELISGRLSRDLRDTDALKAYLDRACTAHLRVITFQRPGKEHRQYELRSIRPAERPPG